MAEKGGGTIQGGEVNPIKRIVYIFVSKEKNEIEIQSNTRYFVFLCYHFKDICQNPFVLIVNHRQLNNAKLERQFLKSAFC